MPTPRSNGGSQLLADQLGKAWRARRATAPIDAVMRFSDEGLVLGAGTVLASADASGRDVRVEGDEPRLLALLAAAHRRAPTATSLTHIRKAARRWNEGEPSLAAIHLALSGLDRLRRPEADAHRLFLADHLLEAGLPTDALLKALDLEPGATGALSKYNPNQPRVPAGSGRTSGEWTAGGGTPTSPPVPNHRPVAARSGRPHARTAQRARLKPQLPVNQLAAPRSGSKPSVRGRVAASTGARLPASLAGAAIAIGRPAVGLDLVDMTEGALARLAAFLAGLETAAAGTSAIAVTAGLVAGLGVLFWPSSGPTGKWVKVGGPGNISYFRSPTEPKLTIRYTTAGGVQREWSGAPDPDGNYKGPDGRVIARWVKRAAKAGLVVSTAALLGTEEEGPQLCPAPVDDPGSEKGRAYEDFAKRFFNPGNPTPSGMAYRFSNPLLRESRKIDDCQQRTGVLAEYKGPAFLRRFLKQDKVWGWTVEKWDNQASAQIAVKGTRPLIWFFAEKPVADAMRIHFKKLKFDITVAWLPMPGA